MTKVFIVILNWNQPELTIECVNSVYRLQSTNYGLNVVVVDNRSTDDSLGRLKNLKTKKLKNLKIIENEKNLGYAGGNNVGIRYALKNGADYVTVLNNDTTVHHDLMNQFIDTVRRDKNIGVLSPKIYFAKGFEFHKDRYKKEDLGRVIWYAGGKINWNNVYGSNRGVDEVDNGQYNKVEETDFATGTCMFLPRKLLEKIGMLDEEYFLYYEDTDLSLRAKKTGFKVVYVPNSVVWHKVAQSSGIGSELNDYYTTRNRMLFGIKYAPLRTKFALFRESVKLLLNGRKWQKSGVKDYYLGNFGKGSWPALTR